MRNSTLALNRQELTVLVSRLADEAGVIGNILVRLRPLHNVCDALSDFDPCRLLFLPTIVSSVEFFHLGEHLLASMHRRLLFISTSLLLAFQLGEHWVRGCDVRDVPIVR